MRVSDNNNNKVKLNNPQFCDSQVNLPWAELADTAASVAAATMVPFRWVMQLFRPHLATMERCPMQLAADWRIWAHPLRWPTMGLVTALVSTELASIAMLPAFRP